MANAYEEMQKLLKNNQNMPEGNAFNQMSSMLTPAKQPPLSEEDALATEDFYQKILNSTKPQQEPIYSPLFKNVTSPEMINRDPEDEALAMEEEPKRELASTPSPVVRNMQPKEVEQKQQFVNSTIDLNKLMNDPEMADALERQKSDMLMATLGRSASNLGHALAQVKPQADYFSGAEKLAKADVDALKEVRKSGYDKFKQGAEIKEISEMDDGNSETSKQLVAGVQELLRSQGLNSMAEKISGLSGNLINKNFATYAAIAKAKSDRDQRALDRENKDAERKDRDNVGQKQVDKDYAKAFNTFTQKGAVNAGISIGKLEELASELEKEKDGIFSAGAGRSSVLPDVMRNKQSIKWRDNARNFANTTLKELFGGQLSDAEREAAAKEYYNDALSNADNAQIIKSKVSQLKENLRIEKAKAKYYEKNKTLGGFESETLQDNYEPMKQAPTTDTESKIQSFMKKNNITDKNEAIKILKAHGKI